MPSFSCTTTPPAPWDSWSIQYSNLRCVNSHQAVCFLCFQMVTSDELLQVLTSHFQSWRTYFRKVPPLALNLLLAKASVNRTIWGARSLSGWACADPVLGSYLKVTFNLLPFSICQQASHLVYAELRKQGLGLARRDRWPQPPSSGRKEMGLALPPWGSVSEAQEHLLPKGACLQGHNAVCPQTPGAPQSKFSGEGGYGNGSPRGVVITLAHQERRSDNTFES